MCKGGERGGNFHRSRWELFFSAFKGVQVPPNRRAARTHPARSGTSSSAAFPPSFVPPSLGPLYPRTVSGHDENQPGPAASRQTNCVPNFPPFFSVDAFPKNIPESKSREGSRFHTLGGALLWSRPEGVWTAVEREKTRQRHRVPHSPGLLHSVGRTPAPPTPLKSDTARILTYGEPTPSTSGVGLQNKKEQGSRLLSKLKSILIVTS